MTILLLLWGSSGLPRNPLCRGQEQAQASLPRPLVCRHMLDLPWKEETFLVLQSLLEQQVSRWGRRGSGAPGCLSPSMVMGRPRDLPGR